MLPDSVLIVDDEPIVIDVLKVALEKKDLRVVTAEKIAEARTLLTEQAFGCVLVDKNLPDGTGLDLIRYVRERQPFCACMVMTGYPNVESIIQALRLGAVDYLEKPFPQLSIVQEKVMAAIARQKVAMEHASLVRAVQDLKGQLRNRQSEDFRAQTELEMLQHALQVRADEALKALSDHQSASKNERADLTTQLESLNRQNSRALESLRMALAGVTSALEGFHKPGEREAQLAQVKRVLSGAIDTLTLG